MGLLFILLPAENTICLYCYNRWTRVSPSKDLRIYVQWQNFEIHELWSRSGEVFQNSTYVRQSDPLYPKMTTHFRIICTCISLMKAFALPKYRHLRGILFLVFGMCGIAPCVHSTFFHGVEYSFSKEMFDQN